MYALVVAGVLTGQFTEGVNIHIANQGGAINRHKDVRVTVNLKGKGKVTVEDRGTDRDHNLYKDYSTTETTAWTDRWSGTWAMAKGELRLELALDKRTCTKTKQHSDAQPEQLTCDAVDKAVTLTCVTETITMGLDKKGKKVATWRCATESELADTPAVWTLGKSACLRAIQGMHGMVYEACEKP